MTGGRRKTTGGERTEAGGWSFFHPAGGQGTSAGQIVVSTTAQNIVTGIGSCATGIGATNGAQLAYTLNINTMTSLVANESKSATITFTLTDS